MKTTIVTFILLISMSFIACKKENATAPATNIQKLIGKWDMVSEVTNDYYSGSPHVTTYNYQPGDYTDFKIGGKYYSYNSGSTFSSDFGIINESTIWIGLPDNVFQIKVLTDSDLQLYKKTVSGADYYESTLNLKK